MRSYGEVIAREVERSLLTWGDEGVMDVLRKSRAGGAEDALRALVEAVHAWAGPLGCADDLTALVVRAV